MEAAPEGDEQYNEAITTDPSEKIQMAVQKACHNLFPSLFASFFNTNIASQNSTISAFKPPTPSKLVP